MAPTPLRHPQTDGQRAALIRWYWRITVCTLTAKRPSVREYHFTVKAGDPVLNWHLREEVKSIPATAIGNATQNGRRVKALSMPVAALDSSGAAMDAVSDSTGSFVYDGNLAVGDTVAIYEGTAPEERVAVGTT